MFGPGTRIETYAAPAMFGYPETLPKAGTIRAQVRRNWYLVEFDGDRTAVRIHKSRFRVTPSEIEAAA